MCKKVHIIYFIFLYENIFRDFPCQVKALEGLAEHYPLWKFNFNQQIGLWEVHICSLWHNIL